MSMTHRIDIVLAEGFPLLSLALVSEPLRVANRESLGSAYDWRYLSAAGGVVHSSSGIALPTVPVDDRPSDAVILLSSYHPETALTPELMRWLRARARKGTLMGCVDTGALVFAEAGLLRGRPAAAHFEAIPGYSAQYPQEMFVDRLYDFSPPRCSGAGGVATFDMTLEMISHFSGARLADRVAGILTYVAPGHPGAQERMAGDRALGLVNRDLARAVEIMVSTLQAPVTVVEIGARTNVPVWHLARLFRRHLHKSPSAYYLGLRLERARNLLRNSHHRVGEIASLCGFENHETFTRAYRREFGLAPSHDRGD